MLEALAPFHPRLVHFPIALALAGVFFVVLGSLRRQDRYRACGQLILLLSWFGIMAAVVSGLVDQSFAPQDAAVTAVLDQHITAGIALLVAVGLALYWPLRNKGLWSRGARWGYFGLLGVIALLVIVEAWLGGKLVYDFGVGVRQIVR
jgi:uncharacterized membrane protein